MKFTDDLIELGFRRDRLSKIYLSVVKRHGLKNKFGIGCGNILIPYLFLLLRIFEIFVARVKFSFKITLQRRKVEFLN